MESDYFSDLAITETIKEEFGMKLDITRMLVRNAQVSPVANASLFRAKGGAIYALVRSSNNQTLGDMKKLLRNMGIESDAFIPPGGIEDYFADKAIEKYKKVFPGKRINNDAEELRYYKTLVPYNPALARVAKIGGEIREYDPLTRTWYVVKRISYKKINTTA
jgi:hypothetical protein